VCGKIGEGGSMHVIGYCNSSLNNKNTNYHCPIVFLVLGFHVNHYVNCVIVFLSGLFLVLFSFPLNSCYVYAYGA
jgi:hypothetical protein